MKYIIAWGERSGNVRRGASDTRDDIGAAEPLAADRSREFGDAYVSEAGTCKIVQRWQNGKRLAAQDA